MEANKKNDDTTSCGSGDRQETASSAVAAADQQPENEDSKNDGEAANAGDFDDAAEQARQLEARRAYNRRAAARARARARERQAGLSERLQSEMRRNTELKEEGTQLEEQRRALSETNQTLKRFLQQRLGLASTADVASIGAAVAPQLQGLPSLQQLSQTSHVGGGIHQGIAQSQPLLLPPGSLGAGLAGTAASASVAGQARLPLNLESGQASQLVGASYNLPASLAAAAGPLPPSRVSVSDYLRARTAPVRPTVAVSAAASEAAASLPQQRATTEPRNDEAFELAQARLLQEILRTRRGNPPPRPPLRSTVLLLRVLPRSRDHWSRVQCLWPVSLQRRERATRTFAVVR